MFFSSFCLFVFFFTLSLLSKKRRQMELADDRLGRANRRANAGNRLQELLEQGLDAEEERLLEALSEVSSDSSFRGSDEEAIDLIDSDFSEEEVDGTLEGEVIETDATVRREERKERQDERKRRLLRSQQFSSSGAASRGKRSRSENAADGMGKESERNRDYRAVGRLRPPPTIPLETRLADAVARAEAIREAEAENAEHEGENDDEKATREAVSGARGGASASRVAAASSGQQTRRRRRRRVGGGVGSSGSSWFLPMYMTELILSQGHVPDAWWDVETSPLTYTVFASHCPARMGWLCSPTLPPLYLAAAQDRAAYLYTSPCVPEFFSVNARGDITPVEASGNINNSTHHSGAGASKRRQQASAAASKQGGRTEAPIIAYLLAPPRASQQPVGYSSGLSTLASCSARTVLSFSDLPLILQGSLASQHALNA